MKILQISDLAPPHIGGVEKIVWKYSTFLAKKGQEVKILTSILPGTNRFETIENVSFIRVPKIALSLPILYSKGFDIIHSHSYFSFYELSLEKKLNDRVILKHIHSVYGSELEEFTGWSFSKVFSKLEKSLINADCTAYIVPSEFTKNKLLEYGVNKKIHVIPHGVEFETYPTKIEARKFLNLPENKKIVGFIGRMSKGKGPQDIAKIWKYIKKAVPEALLIYIGPEPEVKTSGIVGIGDEIRKILDESHISDSVIFAGRVEEEKMPYYIASMDVYVSPSINEGFGLSILNSMAAGIPVVAYNNSAIPEVVDNAGILVKTRDLESLKDSIISLLTDEKLSKELSEKSKIRAKLFSWDSVIDMLLDVYSNYL